MFITLRFFQPRTVAQSGGATWVP